ncbi:MAG: putative transcriptional regulator YdeE [Planctomycetota bacterium]|jgi:predicted transcriptional regulator YdeE
MSNSLDPELRTAGPLHVIALKTRTSNGAEMMGAGKIAALYELVGSRSSEIADDSSRFSVYHAYESDQNGQYDLAVGFGAEANTSAPAGWIAVDVPAAEYLVFRAEGEMPGAVIDTWMRIWGHFGNPESEYVRTYTVDFEQHGEAVDIFIAVVPRG